MAKVFLEKNLYLKGENLVRLAEVPEDGIPIGEPDSITGYIDNQNRFQPDGSICTTRKRYEEANAFLTGKPRGKHSVTSTSIQFYRIPEEGRVFLKDDKEFVEV